MGTLYRQRRAGAAVLHRNGGVLPGLSVKTNGLPTDDMSMREDTRTKFSPASPGWGLRGREQSLLRDPQNSSGAKPATGASPWTEPVLPPGFGPSFGGRQFWLDMVAPMGWPSLDGRLAAGGQAGAAAQLVVELALPG